MTHDDLLARYGLFSARAPRYTSYPASPNFRGDVDAGKVADWVAAIPPGSEISLYVHIPFCRRLCRFCACRTQGTSTDAPLAPYVARLEREIAAMAARMPDGVRLSRLHWGGGTPTILPPDLIHRLARAIRAQWPMAEDGEFSVEIDPTMLDDARLDALAAEGMTRASLGVQDFAPDVQDAIGRPQSLHQTRYAIEGLRARGIHQINLDLVYGLPFQTSQSLTDTMQSALSLGPDRLALYGYAHVPWVARRQVTIPKQGLPDGRARLTLFRTAARLLEADGYVPIGIDHFARPEDGLAVAAHHGRLRRNFQGYTDDQAQVLLGLGASSISRFPQGYAQNEPRTSQWAAMVEAGQIPVVRGHTFTQDDVLRGAMIERLLCDFMVKAGTIADQTGTPEVVIRDMLQDLAARWPDVVFAGGGTARIMVPELARMVAQDLDAYAVSEGRHSMAV